MYSNILVSIDLGQPDNESKAIETVVEYAKAFGASRPIVPFLQSPSIVALVLSIAALARSLL